MLIRAIIFNICIQANRIKSHLITESDKASPAAQISYSNEIFVFKKPHQNHKNQSNCWQITWMFIFQKYERKSEQTRIPHAPTLVENAVYNIWQFQALVTGNWTENQFHLSSTK